MTKTKLIPLLLTLCAAVAFDASARYKGDLNGDDRVDLADMVYLAKAINSESADKSLDINASGSVDDNDLQRLADIIISGKLNEETGMNVGIGGWEETDEDFGGTVKAPAFTTRSPEEIRFYMHSPRSEGDGRYSMEFGISEGNEAPAAVLFNIRLPREMQFDESEIVVLDSSIASSHKLYGTPKFVKENEEDEWSACSLRFIVLSPALSACPSPMGALGRIFYSVDDCFGEPTMVNCQIASPVSGECVDISEHQGDYYGNFKPVEIQIQSITLDVEELSLEVGDTHQFIATVLPAEATYPELEWWIDDETVATVDQNGLLTMVGEGTTTVHVRSVRWPDIEATCRLNVTDAVDGIIADDAPCDIYTTNGKLLKQSVPASEIQNLDRGIYIIRQRGNTTKLLK